MWGGNTACCTTKISAVIRVQIRVVAMVLCATSFITILSYVTFYFFKHSLESKKPQLLNAFMEDRSYYGQKNESAFSLEMFSAND